MTFLEIEELFVIDEYDYVRRFKNKQKAMELLSWEDWDTIVKEFKMSDSFISRNMYNFPSRFDLLKYQNLGKNLRLKLEKETKNLK